MGMSASQARLLSLMARMSDVEYEGQQINQQRLVLSNKMNEVMERMTNMDVPTPPSKQDFLYNTYKGKTKNGKSIHATMNDDGTFNITKEVSGHIVEDGGLENITNGAEIRGSKMEIPYTGVEGQFKDTEDSSIANAHRATSETNKEDLTIYDKSDYRCVYKDSSDKASGWKVLDPAQESAYTDRDAKGDSYAIPNGGTKITVPQYELQVVKRGGIYKGGRNGVYYGENPGTSTKTDDPAKYDTTDGRLTQAEIDSKNADIDKYNEGKEDKDKKPRITKTNTTPYYTYKQFNPETGEPTSGKSDYILSNTVPSALGNLEAGEYKLVKTGEKEIDLFKGKDRLTNEEYTTALNAAVAEYDELIQNGKVKQSGEISVGDAGVTAFDKQKGYEINGAISDKFDINAAAKFLYNIFIGDEAVGDEFANSSREYKKIGAGKGPSVSTGAELIKHNKTAEEKREKEYFYKSGDSYVKCSGAEAAELSSSVYESLASGGQGMVDRYIDKASLAGKGYYVYKTGTTEAYALDEFGVSAAIKGLLDGSLTLFAPSASGSERVLDAKHAKDVTVNGKKTIPLTAAVVAEYKTDTKFQNALSGLLHSFKKDGETDEQCYSQFSVIINPTDGTSVSYSFCRTADLTGNAESGVDNQVRVYNPGVGKYDETINNVEVQYDENGYLQNALLPNGEIVSMEIIQEVDEIEYDKAMNKYNIAKIEYDKEVNELNKQTSIYQRQDKQLELKLTRLDTERNALNTEIDAVKKVIQDATEKGFKTFSG